MFFFVVVISVFPWPEIFSNIYGYEMIDRGVYTNYFLYEESVLNYKVFDGPLSYIKDEYLWHYLVGYAVDNSIIKIEQIYFVISFVCLFVYSLILIRTSKLISLIFLVNPLVIDFAFSQLRLAFAIALIGIAYLVKSKKIGLAVFVVILSTFIHSAAGLFIFIYIVVWLLDYCEHQFSIAPWLKFVLLCSLGVFISLVIGPLREVILSAVGDRRAEYPDMSSSITYSLFWILLLASIGFRLRDFVKEDYNNYTIVILSIVTTNTIHGGYSTRFLAAAFPFLVSTIFFFQSAYSQNVYRCVVGVFTCYAILQWFFWLRII